MSDKIRRRTFLKSIGGGAFSIGLSSFISPQNVFGTTLSTANENRPTNILFIVSDDLRPNLSCYGDPVAITPNIDTLAKNGIIFTNAYSQAPLCNPSRASMLTGCRPDTIGVHMNHESFRDTKPDLQTLPQYFKNKGYHTQSIGKICHHEDIKSWSVPSTIPEAPMYGNKETMDQVRKETERLNELKEQKVEKDPETGLWTFLTMPGPSWEAADVEDNYLYDGKVAEKGIEALSKLKDKPFFLCLGFVSSHFPLVAPREYFDMYRESDIKLPENDFIPKNCPDIAVTEEWVNEWMRYKDLRKIRHVPKNRARQLIHAYYAATSYIDSQVGKVLKELDRLELRNNTIIVFWGDQGFTLKEHDLWGKETLFEVANRCPLIISAPGWRKEPKQVKVNVESIDIYPTVCDLCRFNVPKSLEGTSLISLIKEPNADWNKPAFSQMSRGNITGYSMRTERYRYTEWREAPKIVARELYDHDKDPGENINIAGEPKNNELIETLSKKMSLSLTL